MNDKIICMGCGKKFGSITSQHLLKCCGLTLNQYKEKYPLAETISEKGKAYRKQNCKNLIGQTKIIKCSKCGNDMKTASVNHWEPICDSCRKPETYPGKIYLLDKDLVICQICFQGLEQITWMHTRLHDITLQEYREKFPKAWVTNKKIREDRRKRYTGKNNPAKRPDVRKIMSKAQRFTARDYIKRYPWVFPEIEKIRDNFGVIEIQCKYCEKWFTPTAIQMCERLRALNHGSDGLYFYCSNECKEKCPLYRLNPSFFLSAFKGKHLYTMEEYYVFKTEVLKRQKFQYGYNFCERCEGTKNLQIHHEKPQKTHPIMALDPDNGIIVCAECHFKKIHVGECSTGSLANWC